MTSLFSISDPFIFIAIAFIIASLIILRKRWAKYDASAQQDKILARAQRFSELHAQKNLILKPETPEEKQYAQREKQKRQRQIKAWKRQIIMAFLAALIFIAFSSYQSFFSNP